MLHLLLSNYNDINYVMSLDTYDFFNLLDKLFKDKISEKEEKQEERLFNLWGYQLPVMKDPISYVEYKKKVEGKTRRKTQKPNQIQKRDNKELIAKIEMIKENHQKEVGE